MINFIPRTDCQYKYDYPKIFADIAAGHIPAIPTYRELILNDLFFIVAFVLGVEPANHPFVVNACLEVETGPQDYTLDVWAREHFKTTVITVAQTIQRHMRNPELCVGFFSITRPIAKAFLRNVKHAYEQSQLLLKCFPEILWSNTNDSPKWSEDDGLILRRKSFRREASLEAWGLLEGMPTSKHFDVRVYDDVETDDVVQNPETVQKLRNRFDLSQNLGTSTGTHQVIGTYYTHEGLLSYLRDLQTEDGKSVYYVRKKPATDDGTPTGEPVLLPQAKIDRLKLNPYIFNCQQLLDPSPIGERKLESRYFQEIEPQFIPKNLLKFMLIDPAGDNDSQKGDAWAIGVMAVDPSKDDIGASNVYLTDLVLSPMRHEDAIQEIVRMYLRNGMISCVGVEKVGLSTTEVHVANALKEKKRFVSQDTKSLYLLKPKGRKKTDRIISGLAWPLFNSKLFVSKSIPDAYRQRLYNEADKFPYWHDDGLDMWSYLYDVLSDPDYKFMNHRQWSKPLTRPKMGIL